MSKSSGSTTHGDLDRLTPGVVSIVRARVTEADDRFWRPVDHVTGPVVAERRFRVAVSSGSVRLENIVAAVCTEPPVVKRNVAALLRSLCT